MQKPILRFTAQFVLLSLIYQLVYPMRAYALTTGPTQPEVQSFEPVGTTDMVNTFTGDFVYNIPLLDVEGYPVNISYHSGGGIETESSWTGSGWNINPGSIVHTVRGMPDDFKGERIERELNIRPEKNVRVGAGGGVGFELFGSDKLSASLNAGFYGNYNNYKGVSGGVDLGFTIAVPHLVTGVNIGLGSQSGADVNTTASFSLSSKVMRGTSVGVNIGASTGFNSRQGMQDLHLYGGVGTGMPGGFRGPSVATSQNVLIGIQNYVPVITNPSKFSAFQFQIKGGGEVYYAYPNGYINAQFSTLSYDQDGTRNGYGYLYSESAGDEAIMDFSRDRDGIYNKTMSNLPPGTMAYDVYNVSGQGTYGSFRPFRNDIGTFHDPYLKNVSDNDNDVLEFGYGNLFEVGNDFTIYDDINETGPWTKVPYQGNRDNSLYEKTYFKEAGELTYNNQQSSSQLFNDEPIYLGEDGSSIRDRQGQNIGTAPTVLGHTSDRSSRASLISYFTGEECTIPEVAQTASIVHYSESGSGNSRFYDPQEHSSPRFGNNDFDLRGHQLNEFIQTQSDGRRYVYGIPAVNHMSRELSFSVNENNADWTTGLVNFTPGNQDSKNNTEGREHYYNSVSTPAYAHSYLLTEVLSTDYVDILGDGATDDDMGSYVKFNYKLWDNDYRWRTPYSGDKGIYNPGFVSDPNDGKGMYTVGSRQQWQLRTIETKNYIAEFYVSPRQDGLGSTAAVLSPDSKMRMPAGVDLKSVLNAPGTSFKLDSIRLFNKHERYLKENAAVPLRTVIFNYDYSLCKGIPNTTNTSEGKLTLKQIYIRYGNSDKNLLSPYTFSYTGPNPSYDFAAKDRWGNYKRNNTALSNYEFPYTQQAGSGLDDTAASWQLTDIKLPSGGSIHVDYEQKDYSFIQDQRSMTMIMLEGVGNSTRFDGKNILYEASDKINDYVYFRRDKSRERTGVSLWDNYLEGQTELYYNFNVDITGNGRFEPIKGYAKIEEIAACTDNSDYGYIKLGREDADGMQLPAPTVYGINYARYYLPHVLYPGFPESDGDAKIATGLVAAAKDLVSLFENPFKRFIEEGKARKIRLEKSWMRMQLPGLTKRGGGVRVKRLILNDNWSTQTGASTADNASYGKEYDYTIQSTKYGVISSGVATYEPMVGGDENPFRRPVPYTATGGRKLPAIEFFQEEPFGESFFPGPSIGYSSVKVRSIHADEARSAQAFDEYLYYTAKDFPIQVAFTKKEAPPIDEHRSLRKTKREEHALQGYVLRFNDMHGRPMAVNQYTITETAAGPKPVPVTKTIYHYNTDGSGRLSSKVRALVRNRGSRNQFSVQDVELGKEMDFSVDSRSSYFRSYSRTVNANVNAVILGVPPLSILVPIPSLFFPDQEDVRDFRMLVSTKIVQQYGILSSVEHYDHGATTVVNNDIYDAESGRVLLSSVNNEFGDKNYSLNYPAHMAYLGMGPAYTNVDYRETGDSLLSYGGSGIYLKTSYRERFYKGDELLVTYKMPSGTDTSDHYAKLWVVDIGNEPNSDVPSAIINHCRIKLAPRSAYQSGVSALPLPLGGVSVRVLRSGRRNMLDKDVQQTMLAQNPYGNSVADLFGNTTANGSAFNRLISVSGANYADDAQLYEGQMDSLLAMNGSIDRSFFNTYVTGQKGNFRQSAAFAYNGSRNYAKGHVRYDGTFALNDNLWVFANGNGYDCRGNEAALLFNSSNAYHLWQSSGEVRHIDLYGHVIEEQDATGSYSAAQYGYNQSLPTAVAVNAKQTHFFFDGFEENRLLAPQVMRLMMGGSAAFSFSPFAACFRTITGLGSFTNANASGSSLTLRRSAQSYNLLTNSTGNVAGLFITRDASHTGYAALKTTTAVNVTIPATVSDPNDMIHISSRGWQPKLSRQFALPVFRKNVVSLWMKSVSGNSMPAPCSVSYQGSTVVLSAKSPSIDGWYLFEGQLDFTALATAGKNAALSIPANVYVDDVRMVPVDASMKSFVYDPLSLRVIAELDEHHMASFYEYDQQGLLVRTKKETSQGIKTLTESRRANPKQ